MAENITNNAAWEQAKCLPRHIAIILDGNGRGAKKRLLPRNAGHLAGSETFRNIATYCKEIGVEYLTVYAFSTENWKRPEEEVGGIMKLLDDINKRGTTIVMATHARDIVDAMQKRVVTLQKGHIIRDIEKGGYSDEA